MHLIIASYWPIKLNVIFLQELDHPKLVFKALQSIGYAGKFLHKPDSPCLYLQNNNGPDGAAIFFKTSKFDLISWTSKVLKVWDVASNQVKMIEKQLTLIIKSRSSSEAFSAVVTAARSLWSPQPTSRPSLVTFAPPSGRVNVSAG